MGMFGALIIDPVVNNTPAPLDGMPEKLPGANGSLFTIGELALQAASMGASPINERTFIFSEYDAKHKHIPMPGEMMPMGPDGVIPWLIPSPKFGMPFDPQLDEFMINGKSFPAVPPVVVEKGQVVRFRLINLGLNIHSIHIHGHHFVVTHRDGFKLPQPFSVDTLLIGPGERYDVWFAADNPGLWMVHDHAGMNAMAKGYDPAGVMFVIQYKGISTDAYDDLLERVKVYNEIIEHADEDHGMLTPSGAGGMDMGGMDMGGMEMGGGH